MTGVLPRRLVHRGWVEAAGFLIHAETVGLAEARRRVLELWSPGVQVHRVEGGYCVRLYTPRRVECENAPGAPLVKVGQSFTATPLAPDELSALDPRPGSVIYAKGGAALVETPAAAELEAPEEWLDLSAFAPAEVESLGLKYATPRVVAEPEPFDARAKLDGVPAPAPELIETLAELKSVGSTKGGVKPSARGAGASREPARARLARLAKSLSKSLSNFFRGLARTESGAVRGDEGSGKARGGRANADGRAPSAEGWFSRSWRGMAARVLRTTRLARLVGRRQAAYLMKMMDMFERGDIDEALRHAVPLADLPTSLHTAPAFGVPRPRGLLKIQPWQSPASTTIGMGCDVMHYLRQLYRASFERLEAQGRFEAAAFVLAELLRANEEAVAFLERHGRLRLAAELAEARELSADLVVRQWFMAGDVERAIRIARRTQAFAAAVTRLEKTDRKKAEELRLLWAASLVQAGNYAAAVDVIWPLADERHRAKEWMEQVIELGGPAAAKMLARKLSLVPAEFDEIKRHTLALLEDESYEQRGSRLVFAETLCRGERTRGAQALARAAARAVLRDAGQGPHPMPPKQFRSLVDFSGDGALRTDVPPFPALATGSRPEPGQPARLEFSSIDRGPTPVADAALLEDGRLLVALGEAGVKLLTRDGRTAAHFDQPAGRLVVSDHGDRAIALAPRGEVWRLARLDFVTRRAEEWCEARVEAFAPDFDGALWFVGVRGEFYAVDATAKSFDALWRVPEAGEMVLGVARSATMCRFLTAGIHRPEMWAYDLPLLVLRNRTEVEMLPDDDDLRGQLRATLSAAGLLVDQSLYLRVAEAGSADDRRAAATPEIDVEATMLPLPLRLRVFDSAAVRREFEIGDADARPGQPEVRGQLVASPVYERGGARVRLFDLRQGRVTSEMYLAGASRVSTKLTEKTLTVADDCGRVLVLDHERDCLIRNLRV
ncbi:MAG TPA: bpX6 domain-containing protein [Pyrinomonadaceae bacterium]|nr:bpX6 domain-containing protein [Pyrinomonadaceae bacterium]